MHYTQDPAKKKLADEKRKQTNMRLHGAANGLGKDALEKCKQTCLEHFGVENAMKSSVVQDKIKQSNLKKYGVENVFQAEEIKKQIKGHWLEKEKVDHVSKSMVIKEKKKETFLQKYNGFTYDPNSVLKDKSTRTMLEKYGVKHALQNEEIKEKVSRTNMEIGANTGLKLYSNLTLQSIKELRNQNDVTDITIANMLKLSPSSVSKHLRKMGFPSGTITSPEQKVIDLLLCIQPNLNLSVHDRQAIKPLEIDIYLPDFKFGIEIHGAYWHNENYVPMDYHQKKFLEAQKVGIRLIQVFDYELEDLRRFSILSSMIKSHLGNSRRIGARNCDIKMVGAHTATTFYQKNHWQGSRGATYHYALFYKQVPVAMMSVGKSRFEKDTWELIRFASLLSMNIIGAPSKLLKAVLTDHPEIKKLVSYSDNRLFQGKSYQKMGFQPSENYYIDYVWWKEPSEYHFRYECQKHKLQKFLKENFRPEETEIENMQRCGYLRIFGAGQTKWILNAN